MTLVAALSIGACGSDEQEQAAANAEAEAAVNELAAQLEAAANAGEETAEAGQQAIAPPPAAGAGESNFGTVSLVPGFAPDPHTADGTSGGNTDASTVNDACAGWIASSPDHLFVAGGAFASLRVMAHSDADLTLVIQKPDGSYLCNDDSDTGTDPLVSDAFAPGTYKIWVGSYEQGVNSRYTLGISEMDDTVPSSLGE